MRLTRFVLGTLAAIIVLFILLSIPLPESTPAAPVTAGAFAWSQDSLWHSLEARYRDLRGSGCSAVDTASARGLAELDSLISWLETHPVSADAPELDRLEILFFGDAPRVAACPQHGREYLARAGRLRTAIKWQSLSWDLTSTAVRSRIYRALYGSRAALEETMLQHPDSFPALLPGVDEPSATPSAMVHGVEIHSGDMLVSRGGYPTSALIARGNDYPGNFSHVALVYVDSAIHVASTIEAHIERGVAISSAEEYLGDKKLRIMVLRPRADLPALVADPLLPHKAAAGAIARARSERIRYDFAMDYTDPSRLFCSEVASSVYRDQGITLWTGISTISSPGLRRWLGSFGVRHFETQEPSDLEYDPQLVVVAEWRDPATLRQDHIDNAVIDAMLEGAESGDRLQYPWYQLAVVRLAKGYSWVLNRFGKDGPVPEGMSAPAALRNTAFSARQRRMATEVSAAADSVARELGYPPPYWTLLELARQKVQDE
jgi:hypothetical protein